MAARDVEDAEAQPTPYPQDAAASTQKQYSMENTPLQQRKWKAVVDPANEIVEVGSLEVLPQGSQLATSLRARASSRLQVTQGSIFK